MRRKKKLILNILGIAAIFLIAVAIIAFFVPRKNIKTADTKDKNSEYTSVDNIVAAEKADVILPDTIYSESNNTSSEDSNNTNKTFEPLVEDYPARYLITLNPQGNTDVKVLIGPDSESLLNNNSKVQISSEYPINNIPENIKSDYTFKVDGYDYPILLLLGESGKLYYVDIEKAYKTGNFEIDGYIENIPEADRVYATTTTENGNKRLSAVIVCTDGSGYEFNLNMIGR